MMYSACLSSQRYWLVSLILPRWLNVLDPKTSPQQNATQAQPQPEIVQAEQPQIIEGLGERGRNRTFNLLIKSQLLCQLSYAPGSECGNKEGLARTSSSPDLSITAPVRFGEDASKTKSLTQRTQR
jgi:hypothetical protein